MAKKKDTSVIPRGVYCYSYDEDGTYRPCPYYGTVDGAPSQYNGYCDYLRKGNLDLEKEMVLENIKTGEKSKGSDLPFPVSLLWDQCKECGINTFDNDDTNND